jgi:hypothetical protein
MRGKLLATATTMGHYSDRGSDLAKIQAAIIESRRLRIHHFAAHRGKVLERTVDPMVSGTPTARLTSCARIIASFWSTASSMVIPLAEVFERDPVFDMYSYVGRGI